MGLLDKLWDDTVAGPRPESGLGKLRKFSSFSPSSSSSSMAAPPAIDVTVTRSITIARSPRSSISADSGSLPSSPASVPDSPLSPSTPRGDWSRFLRKPKQMAEGMETAEPRSPTVYDWVVISSLDR
ncbi:dormancy-associated protein homolog 3-like isoform X2 [Ananas comosus]|uniref:Dormancy-associated protein homolog 3-like isoform X2 n=2 Tax=Ananas comosus TaxID=4615 RepID=A0A6P5F1Y4_ANACO|nr:dormancy-associated protein homolog 3-like isoform X2 [Ananas comosus]CAD1827362.1 unnamed protein product [Ananas comosus var. bracteatus]